MIDLEKSTFERYYGWSARRAGRQCSDPVRSVATIHALVTTLSSILGSGGSGCNGMGTGWVYGSTIDTVFITER